MEEDNYGFVFPAVDSEKCIHCNRCLKSCHMARSDMLKQQSPQEAYGAYDCDLASLRKSASGGVASTLCREVIDQGGIAYGCTANREYVTHNRLTTISALDRARGSKYVQSDMSRVYKMLSVDLKSDVPIVFVGTPCQCAAVRLLFGNYGNLLLVDLVCEGVPSCKMYADFLNDLEEVQGQSVTDFRFRDKCGGWSTKNAVVLGKDGKPLEAEPHSYYYYYYYLFAQAFILRDSCYCCPYASINRVGDITVGDLWGAETMGLGYSLKELRGGISCLMVNSPKGITALEKVSGKLDLRSCSVKAIACSNSCLIHPSKCNTEMRARVLNAYKTDGAAGMKREYKFMFDKKTRLRADIAADIPLLFKVAAKRAKSIMRRSAK